MAGETTLKLATNIPLTLDTLSAVKFQKSKTEGWAHQIAVIGTQAGQVVRVYLPERLAQDLAAQGYIAIDGTQDQWGGPLFKLLRKDSLTILRTEDGVKKFTTINPDTNGTAKARVSGPQKAPAAPKPTKPEPVGERNTPQDWAVLEATYAECVRIAKRTLEASFGTDIGLSDTGLIAATATLFIECNKRGLKALSPAKPPRPLSEMPAPLDDRSKGELYQDDDLGF